MNRRKMLETAGFGLVVGLADVYPEGIETAEAMAKERWNSAAEPAALGTPAGITYLVVDDKAHRKDRISEVLTFLANDRGYKVIAVTGPDPRDGSREYLMARQIPGFGPHDSKRFIEHGYQDKQVAEWVESNELRGWSVAFVSARDPVTHEREHIMVRPKDHWRHITKHPYATWREKAEALDNLRRKEMAAIT